MRKTVPIIKAAFIRHLPDGDLSGTRAKQSKKVKAAFPTKLKDGLVSKQIKDPTGVLQLVGISKKRIGTKPPPLQVRFDHGDKGRKGVGRRHVLWGVYDTGRTKPPLLRRQTFDVRERVRNEVQDRVIRIVIEAIKKAIDKQMGKT